MDGTFQRKDLKDRMIELSPGIIVQRDMLSAYIIEHTNTTLSSINKRECRSDFKRFKTLQDSKIQQLKENHQLAWYVYQLMKK